MEPNPRNIRTLVDALRSGLYRQGARYLHATDPASGESLFCVFGVACDLARADGAKVDARPDRVTGRVAYGNDTDGYHYTAPPDVVQRWLGIAHAEDIPGYGSNLTGLNDAGSSLLDLADILETTYLHDT